MRGAKLRSQVSGTAMTYRAVKRPHLITCDRNRRMDALGAHVVAVDPGLAGKGDFIAPKGRVLIN